MCRSSWVQGWCVGACRHAGYVLFWSPCLIIRTGQQSVSAHVGCVGAPRAESELSLVSGWGWRACFQHGTYPARAKLSCVPGAQRPLLSCIGQRGGGCKLLSGSFWVLSAAGLCVLSFLTLKLLCPCHSAGCRLLFSTCYDRQLRARWYALSVLGRVSTAVLLGLSMCVAPAATFALSMHPPVRAQAAEQDWPHRASKVQVRGSSLHTPVRCALLCTLCAVRKLVLHVSTAGLACWSLDCGRSLVCAIHTCVAGAPHILNVECSRDALSCTLF